jgi:ankyrin repeat protein
MFMILDSKEQQELEALRKTPTPKSIITSQLYLAANLQKKLATNETKSSLLENPATFTTTVTDSDDSDTLNNTSDTETDDAITTHTDANEMYETDNITDAEDYDDEQETNATSTLAGSTLASPSPSESGKSLSSSYSRESMISACHSQRSSYIQEPHDLELTEVESDDFDDDEDYESEDGIHDHHAGDEYEEDYKDSYRPRSYYEEEDLDNEAFDFSSDEDDEEEEEGDFDGDGDDDDNHHIAGDLDYKFTTKSKSAIAGKEVAPPVLAEDLLPMDLWERIIPMACESLKDLSKLSCISWVIRYRLWVCKESTELKTRVVLRHHEERQFREREEEIRLEKIEMEKREKQHQLQQRQQHNQQKTLSSSFLSGYMGKLMQVFQFQPKQKKEDEVIPKALLMMPDGLKIFEVLLQSGIVNPHSYPHVLQWVIECIRDQHHLLRILNILVQRLNYIATPELVSIAAAQIHITHNQFNSNSIESPTTPTPSTASSPRTPSIYHQTNFHQQPFQIPSDPTRQTLEIVLLLLSSLVNTEQPIDSHQFHTHLFQPLNPLHPTRPSIRLCLTRMGLTDNWVSQHMDTRLGVSLMYAASCMGEVGVMRFLKRKKVVLDFAANHVGWTPWIVGCVWGNSNVVEFLLENVNFAAEGGKVSSPQTKEEGVDANNNNNNNNSGAGFGEINLERSDFLIGNTGLHYACALGHLQIIQLIVKKFATSPQSLQHLLELPRRKLHSGPLRPRFTSEQDSEIRRFLSQFLSDQLNLPINSPWAQTYLSRTDFTPLSEACFFNHPQIVSYLLSKPEAGNNEKNKNGTMSSYRPSILSPFIRTPQVNSLATNPSQKSLLYMTLSDLGNVNVARVLIKETDAWEREKPLADRATHPERQGFTLLHRAVQMGHVGAVEFILETEKHLDETVSTLNENTHSDNTEKKKTKFVHAKDELGCTPLHIAIERAMTTLINSHSKSPSLFSPPSSEPNSPLSLTPSSSSSLSSFSHLLVPTATVRRRSMLLTPPNTPTTSSAPIYNNNSNAMMGAPRIQTNFNKFQSTPSPSPSTQRLLLTPTTPSSSHSFHSIHHHHPHNHHYNPQKPSSPRLQNHGVPFIDPVAEKAKLVSVIRCLCAYGAEIDVLDNVGRTPLGMTKDEELRGVLLECSLRAREREVTKEIETGIDG